MLVADNGLLPPDVASGLAESPDMGVVVPFEQDLPRYSPKSFNTL